MANLDKFYTKPEIAEKCLNLINLSYYNTIVEPSAGNGSFSNLLDCIALDIEPENEKIVKQDFLILRQKFKDEPVLFIGNPPFGIRSAIAKEFINQSIKLNAHTIAFILPQTFLKLLNQKVFPSDWYLKDYLILPKNSFTENGKDIDIPCVFMIWTKEKCKDLREIQYSKAYEFEFLSRGDIRADFCVNGNSGVIKNVSEITNSKAEHYIFINNRSEVEEIRKVFENLNFNFYSSVNGKVSWIGQQEILKAWHTQY